MQVLFRFFSGDPNPPLSWPAHAGHPNCARGDEGNPKGAQNTWDVITFRTWVARMRGPWQFILWLIRRHAADASRLHSGATFGLCRAKVRNAVAVPAFSLTHTHAQTDGSVRCLLLEWEPHSPRPCGKSRRRGTIPSRKPHFRTTSSTRRRPVRRRGRIPPPES